VPGVGAAASALRAVRFAVMEAATDLDHELRAHGYRVTLPRRAVWEALRHSGGHVTVEELVERLGAGGAEVDPASVYRTLALFAELGLARVNRLGGGEAGRWELAHPDEHFHLVCEVCGDVDHHVGSLVQSIRQHLDEGHGFLASDVDLVVTGRCARCRGVAVPPAPGSQP
jgi:Fur family ferric uptake transcriptional regulator